MRGLTESTTRALGLLLASLYATLIAWVYAHQPQTVAQVTGGLASAIGTYRIDDQAFTDGLRFFRNDQFVEARMAFARADPALRDPRTHFYIAYSFYRQGWGRLYSDDRLFAEGLAAIDRAIALAPGGRLVVDDPNLQMRSVEELKVELQAGMRRDRSDFNPMHLFSHRK